MMLAVALLFAAPVLAGPVLGEPVLTALQDSAPEESEKQSGHARMLSILEDRRRRAPEEDRWQGEARARQQRERLAGLPADAGIEERWRAHFQLGWEELRIGNETAAIEHLTRAYEIIPEPLHRESWAVQTVFRLGMAHLRRAETLNCCARNNADSCIVPIRGAALHTDPSGSRQAMHYFGLVLDRSLAGSPMGMKSRWMLNLAAMTLGEFPDGVPEHRRLPASIFQDESGFPRFVNVAPELGLDTFNQFGGVAIEDFDGDGFLDIFTTTSDPGGPCRLFRNHGDGTFTDVHREAGLEGLFGGLNVIQGDVDNDGDVDLFVLRGAWRRDQGRVPNSLLRNQGDGRFVDVTFEAGLGEVHAPSQTASFADYDLDGDLDLFVGNEHEADVVDAPCQLFRNEGDGTFTDVAADAGVQHRAYVKGVVWGDFDGDRWPDVYLSVMGEDNALYRNNGDGTFTNVAEAVGVNRPKDSFPIWFFDFDNDGHLDLYVPSYRGVSDNVARVAASYLGLPVDMELPHLFRGDGSGGLVNVAPAVGLTRVTAPMGANFGDVDGDGYPDIYLGTGYPEYEALMPNVMLRNVAGQRFEDVTFSGGFGHLQKGHAIAFADLDHDGDQDVFAQMGGTLRGDRFGDALFLNPGFGHSWITVRLVGVTSNRSAIGARLRLDVEDAEGESPRTIYRHVNSGGSFGASPLRQTIGLGEATVIRRLTVEWPATGRSQVFENVTPGRIVRIQEGADRIEEVNAPAFDLSSR